MRRKLICFLSVAMVLVLAVLGGCGGDKTESVETGIVLIGVTDKPDEDITSIEVTTNLIEASVSSGSGNEDAEWKVIIDNELSFDLIKVAGVEEILGQAELPAGTYNQIRMHVKSVLVTINGVDKEATVPSGTIKLVRPLEVKAGEKTVATFDFNAQDSVLVTGADKVTFKPVVKLLVRNSDEPFVPEGFGKQADEEDTEAVDESEPDTGDDSAGTGTGTHGKPATTPELPQMKQGDEEGFFLNITSPSQSEVIVATDTLRIAGQTSVDAAVSIGDEFIDVDIDGNFSSNVLLEDGVNIVEVIASIATGQQYEQIITVIYAP
ncbi:MAG: DUF4382 domain-containing protein [Dehalococcoidales bacterium]|nr:DUF4382 domain-containing protein [Dehalococcoidales bacterium]